MSGESHVTVKIPRDLTDEMDKLIGKHGFRSRGEIAKEAVRRLIEHYTKAEEPPTLEHFNFKPEGVWILDRSLEPPKGRLVMVTFQAHGKTLCELDGEETCRHKDFALELPEVRDLFRKEGWKPQ